MSLISLVKVPNSSPTAFDIHKRAECSLSWKLSTVIKRKLQSTARGRHFLRIISLFVELSRPWIVQEFSFFFFAQHFGDRVIVQSNLGSRNVRNVDEGRIGKQTFISKSFMPSSSRLRFGSVFRASLVLLERTVFFSFFVPFSPSEIVFACGISLAKFPNSNQIGFDIQNDAWTFPSLETANRHYFFSKKSYIMIVSSSAITNNASLHLLKRQISFEKNSGGLLFDSRCRHVTTTFVNEFLKPKGTKIYIQIDALYCR